MKSKYVVLLVVSVIAIIAMVWLSGSINERRAERVAITETPEIHGENQYKNDEWERYYPRQYSSWLKTKESGNIHDLLKEFPQLPIIWAGYGFAKDYNAPRGHYYAIQSNTNTLRTGAPTDGETGPMPTACWTCKSPDVIRMIERDGDLEYFTGKWAKYGAEIKNSIGCANCHDNKTSELRVKVPHLNEGLKAAGLTLFENSTHQEKRDLVCATCHSEYYFKKTKWTDKEGNEKVAKVVTFPWHNGLSSEGMEKYYDKVGHIDFINKISKAPILKAQHPGFEMHTTGIHGQKGVACADCHMPYTQEGAVKYSDHQLQSPLNTMDRSCMTCHRESEEKLKAIVYQKYERKTQLHIIAMDNLAKAHLETGKAMKAGATDAELKAVRQDIRTGQWRWDYAVASHGAFFHAPEEVLRNLAMANEYAMNARLKLVSVLAKHGVHNYSAPDFDDKAVSQKLAGLDFSKMVDAKLQFKNTLEKEWNKQAVSNNVWNQSAFPGTDNETAYSKSVNGVQVKK